MATRIRLSSQECSVAPHCLNLWGCPYCANGSEYRPDSSRQRFPRDPLRAPPDPMAQARGRRAKRVGSQAEKQIAQHMQGTVQVGSGQLDRFPNDVHLPNGWLLESRVRRAFGHLWVHRLQQNDLWWIPRSPGLLVLSQRLWDAYPLPSPSSEPLPFWKEWDGQTAVALGGPWTLPVASAAHTDILYRWAYDPREHPDVVAVWPQPLPLFLVLPQRSAYQWLSSHWSDVQLINSHSSTPK